MTNEELPNADPGRESWARDLFSTGLTPEQYAAKEGHRWASFSLDEVRYSDHEINVWIQRLGDIFFGRNGAPNLAELRSTLLTTEEQAVISIEIKQNDF